MTDEDLRSSVRKVALWPIGLMLLVGVVLIGLIHFLLASASWVEHSDRVITQAHRVEGQLLEMQAGLRGYQVTNDLSLLAPHERNSALIDAEFRTLAELVSDNPAAVSRVQSLESAAGQWRGFAGEMIERRRAGAGYAEAAFNARGIHLMDAVRAQAAKLMAGEEALRHERGQTLKRLRDWLFASIGLAVLLLGPLAALWMQRLLRQVASHYRESAERVRRQAEELRVSLRSIGDAVIATDAEGRVTFLNPVAEQLTGWPTLEAAGKTLVEVFSIFNEQTGKAVENPVARVLRERKVVGLANHTVLRARDGREIPIEDSAAPIRGDADEVRGVILVFHDVTEARAVQRQMRESRERLQAALTGSGAGTFRWEIPTNAMEWDDNLDRLFGLPPGQTIRSLENFVALVHPDERPAVIAQCERGAREGTDFDLEFRVVWPDGSVHWLHDRGKVFRAQDGKPLHMTGACVDISARKNAETAQRESEDYLRRLLDSMAESFYGVDEHGVTTICNAAFLRLLGFERAEDAIGRKLHDVIHHSHPDGSHYPKEECPIYRCASAGEPAHVEDEFFFRLDGTAVPVEYWSYPVIRGGERRGAITTFYDITERKQAEEAAREASERFRFLAESMPQKIFTAKPSGDVDYFNREWTQFTGLSFERIRDWGWLQFIHPEDVEENVRRWQHSIETGEPFELEHRFLRLDGQYRWHLSRAFPMRDAEGNVTMWIGSNTDIDDQKRNEEALRESEARIRALFETAEAARVSAEAAKSRAEAATRAKDDFLAALSHELRTPLSPALLLATSLADDTALPSRVREDIEVIGKGIALQAQLVDDLLDITRITGGKLRLDLRPIDAHAALRHAHEIVRTDAQEREITVTLDLAAPHNCIKADAVRMQQIFWNVLKNAVKFTPAGGAIQVHTRNPSARPGTLEVEITDTGIGIEPEMLGSVFDAFVQEEHTGAHRFGGIGLGLAITRRLVELQNGRIDAQSAGRDRGATFRIELPLEAPELCAAAEPAPISPAADSPIARRILLVEDHEQTRATLVRLLEHRGHTVAGVATTAGARERAAAGDCDLVISDLGLPDGDGHALMAELRAAHGLPGIALSGYGMDEDLARSRRSGFFTHLTKPVDIHDLEAAIAAAPLPSSGTTKAIT